MQTLMFKKYDNVIPNSTLSSPLNDHHFTKLGEGLDKGDFYFHQIYIKKNLEIKIFESIKFLKFVMTILRIIHILI